VGLENRKNLCICAVFQIKRATSRSEWKHQDHCQVRQPTHSLLLLVMRITIRVRLPWDSGQYFTVSQSDSRFPFLSPPTTRRSTVEVLDHSSTRGSCKKKSKLCYDQRFSQPVCLGIKHPSGVYDQIFITVRQLQAC
jgi:hypothetical protein